MSAPESSPEEGQKAKRANPRSHYRADGTRRRTKGEKKARQGQGAGYQSTGWTAEWWKSGKDSWLGAFQQRGPAAVLGLGGEQHMNEATCHLNLV